LLRVWPILDYKTKKYYSAKSSTVSLSKVPLLDAVQVVKPLRCPSQRLSFYTIYCASSSGKHAACSML